jgi:hypothetical protein
MFFIDPPGSASNLSPQLAISDRQARSKLAVSILNAASELSSKPLRSGSDAKSVTDLGTFEMGEGASLQ